MKIIQIIFLALLPGLIPTMVLAQMFTKVTTGPVVLTASGSRSVNFLDFNNDDFQDLLITNGTSGGENNLLYRNNGDGTFFDVSNVVSMDGTPTDGATCADFNNDGQIDICAVNWYNINNLLYLNGGGGAYSKIDTGDIPNDNGYSETASWGDADNDGLVDLLVTNSAGIRRNYLYRNLGGGAFERLNQTAPAAGNYTSRSVNWIDIDLDGDQDIFVTNEGNEQNTLYRNDGGMVFTRINNDPLATSNRSSHSASWGDIDNDGDFDVVIANYQQDNQVFLNNGSGAFSEVSYPFGTDGGCSFSSSLADFDNDGDLDLFVTNGYCGSGLQNFLYTNDGNGNFQRVMNEPMAMDSGGSYGCAWADIDNDGFMDLAVANWEGEVQPNSLYRNGGNGNHWLKVKLQGTLSNRSAIGAIIRCRTLINGIPVWQMREVTAQSGYCSQNSLVIHFGLRDATQVDSLEVIWPSGGTQTFTGISADQLYALTENDTLGIVGLDPALEWKPEVKIFPNPTTGDFQVAMELQGEQEVQIEVIDPEGRKVFQRKDSGLAGHLEVPVRIRLAKGMYTVRLTDNLGRTLNRKLVVAE